MEKECECYEEEVQPYRKTDYKPIIYMSLVLPMCILISCSSVLMALGMFMFVKVMSSLISVMSPPPCLCSLSVRMVV